mmetsp:Transcript_72374/g.212373  ORF Transcript_72374/g.212373 Transcript_72374/m.212373 type:complete len:254 (+) Transcript_72374:338-1099(+)
MSSAFTFAPLSSSILRISCEPDFTAKCRAVQCRESLAPTCALTGFSLMSSLTSSPFDSMVASMSVVLPSAVRDAGSQLTEISHLAASVFPLRHAWCSAVQPLLSLVDTSTWKSKTALITSRASLPHEDAPSMRGVTPRALVKPALAPDSSAFLHFLRSPRIALCNSSSSWLLALRCAMRDLSVPSTPASWSAFWSSTSSAPVPPRNVVSLPMMVVSRRGLPAAASPSPPSPCFRVYPTECFFRSSASCCLLRS